MQTMNAQFYYCRFPLSGLRCLRVFLRLLPHAAGWIRLSEIRRCKLSRAPSAKRTKRWKNTASGVSLKSTHLSQAPHCPDVSAFATYYLTFHLVLSWNTYSVFDCLFSCCSLNGLNYNFASLFISFFVLHHLIISVECFLNLPGFGLPAFKLSINWFLLCLQSEPQFFLRRLICSPDVFNFF